MVNSVGRHTCSGASNLLAHYGGDIGTEGLPVAQQLAHFAKHASKEEQDNIQERSTPAAASAPPLSRPWSLGDEGLLVAQQLMHLKSPLFR